MDMIIELLKAVLFGIVEGITECRKHRHSSKNSRFLYISPYNIRIISQKPFTAKYFFREALIFGEKVEFCHKKSIAFVQSAFTAEQKKTLFLGVLL